MFRFTNISGYNSHVIYCLEIRNKQKDSENISGSFWSSSKGLMMISLFSDLQRWTTLTCTEEQHSSTWGIVL